jgi:hypothetical protein
MKRVMVIAIEFVFFIGFFIAAPAIAAPVANLSLVDTPMGIGDTFAVEVWADGDNIGLDLVSFGFDVSFESGDFFNYTGYILGAGFDDDSFGSGNVAGSAFPGIAENDVLLATLSFESVAIGTDTLNVIGLYDGAFSGIYFELEDSSLVGYDINQSIEISNVPIPGAMILMCSGLVGLIRVNRKAKK